jgi:hypothetical protein
MVSPLATAQITYNLAGLSQKLTLTGGQNFTSPPIYMGVKIEIDSFFGIGDYTVTQSGRVKAWFLVSTFELPAKTGTVHVKAYSTKQTTGTFQIATDTLSATDGSFNLHVQ